MIASGDIKAEDILAMTSSSKTPIKLPKVINKVTGKVTSGPFLFSRDKCAKKTKQYATSIKKKGPAFVASLTDIARSALKEQAACDSTLTEDESEDDRAMLCIYMLLVAFLLFTELRVLLAEIFNDVMPTHSG